MIQAIFSLWFGLLISSFFAIQIPIVDEDYIKVRIGNNKQELKLLIDPSSPFTYILKNVFSNTVEETTDTHSFKNIFGQFNGAWKYDLFYLTPDYSFGFRMKYLQIEFKNSALKSDGVIGLGYSTKINPECSLYHILGGMPYVFKFRNQMSYDKKKSILTIGELPVSNNYNPMSLPIFEGEQYDTSTFVNITYISYSTLYPKNYTLIDVNQKGKLGLMSVIIAPHSQKEFIENVHLKEVTNSTLSTESIPSKFFSDIYYDISRKDVNTEFIFGKMAYKFQHSEEKEERQRSVIKIGNKDNELDYWYLGIDLFSVQRADFDYEKKTVTLFSPIAYDITTSKYPVLLWSISICIIFNVIATIFFRLFCAKPKQREFDKQKGDELIDII